MRLPGVSCVLAGIGPWLCALVFGGECPGDNLDLGGTGQRDPHQAGLVVADTSALVRILRRQVDGSWHEQVTHGMVAICNPLLTETLTIARATRYERVRAGLLEAYPRVPVPDRAWDTVRDIQAQLAAKSQGRGCVAARPSGRTGRDRA